MKIKNLQNVRKLALWGKNNPWSARFIIILTHFFIGIGGVEFGLLLFAKGVEFPRVSFYLPFAVFTLAYLAYPNHNKTEKKRAGNFAQRKILDRLLLGSLAMLWLVAGNMLPENLHALQTNAASVSTCRYSHPVVESMLPATREDVARGFKKIWNKGKKALVWFSGKVEKRLDQYQGGKDTTGSIIGIVLLGILLTFLLLYATVAISCNLSCSGNDAAAGIVLFLGLGAIVLLWILLAKWMRRIKAN
jgi:hypothetical protein